MSKLNEYLLQTEKQEVKYWIEHNLKNYLETNPENQGEIEHIIDFLNSKKAPKRLKKMSYDEARTASEKWVKTMIKKAGNIIETEEDVEVIKDFKDGFKLVKLVGENAFKREGKLMSHCVASYYGKDVEVYSLRDSNNNPHCTMELSKNGGTINQIKGKGNGSIHPSYIKYILKALKKFGVDVRESEMKNLGYIKLSNDLQNFVDSKFKDIKYVTFRNTKFLYSKNKIFR